MNKIDKIKQALSEATPGPWDFAVFEDSRHVIYDNTMLSRHIAEIVRGGVESEEREEANAHLIANAPEWLRWCVDEIEQLRKEIIDQRNLFHEKAYKLAKISEDAYIRELREENERLRTALEFYTDSKKYLVSEKYSGGEFMGAWAEICGDSGMVARQALKEVKHE